MRMDLDNWEVAHHVPDPVTVLANKLGVCLLEMARAEGALVVRELDDGHGRVRRAAMGTPLACKGFGRGAPGHLLVETGGRQGIVALRANGTSALRLAC